MIHNPDIVFFDELSTGLDPVSRQEIWNYVGELRKQGKTIIVSTHYMQEAEEICDRVMLVNEGKIVDIGTACELKEKLPFHRFWNSSASGKKRRSCRICSGLRLLRSGKAVAEKIPGIHHRSVQHRPFS